MVSPGAVHPFTQWRHWLFTSFLAEFRRPSWLEQAQDCLQWTGYKRGIGILSPASCLSSIQSVLTAAVTRVLLLDAELCDAAQRCHRWRWSCWTATRLSVNYVSSRRTPSVSWRRLTWASYWRLRTNEISFSNRSTTFGQRAPDFLRLTLLELTHLYYNGCQTRMLHIKHAIDTRWYNLLIDRLKLIIVSWINSEKGKNFFKGYSNVQ